jgi:alanine racemase
MRPLVARIHAAALTHNLNIAREHATGARVMAVVKADAYGHGITTAMHAFATADGLGVLALDEAIALRAAGWRKPVLLLEGPFDAQDMRRAAELELHVVLHGAHQLSWLDAALPAGVFVKLDSGMHRLGFAPEALGAVLEALRGRIADITLMTHFARADEDCGVAAQLEAFRRATRGHDLPLSLDLPVSLANSAALLRYPETCVGWVRPGIMLYGSSPFGDVNASQLGLWPAMSLASELIAVRDLAPGDAVGYGGSFVADRAMRVGVVACGYADGYPRHAPTGTPVAVGGMVTRLLGRVSMDMLGVDVSDIADARPGAPVLLWGESPGVDEVAQAAGTIAYELLTAVTRRVPRLAA